MLYYTAVTRAKVRVIPDGWVLAGFEGFDEGRKKSFDFIDFRALFCTFSLVFRFAATRPDAGEF